MSMRFRNLSIDWRCSLCGKTGNLYIAGGVGLEWRIVSDKLTQEHRKASPGCQAQFDQIKYHFSRLEDKPMATTEHAPTEFHIYVHERDVTVILDPEDPQRTEIMKAMAEVFNKNDRVREADECLGIGIKG